MPTRLSTITTTPRRLRVTPDERKRQEQRVQDALEALCSRQENSLREAAKSYRARGLTVRHQSNGRPAALTNNRPL